MHENKWFCKYLQETLSKYNRIVAVVSTRQPVQQNTNNDTGATD